MNYDPPKQYVGENNYNNDEPIQTNEEHYYPISDELSVKEKFSSQSS